MPKKSFSPGEVLRAADVNEYLTSSRNVIINGAFEINQRAYSSGTANAYGFDMWASESSSGTVTYSSQSFTLGTAPVVGYESANFARLVTTGQSGAGAYSILRQRVENVRTLANQAATISFWAKAATGTPKVAVEFGQNFGTGGSPSATVNTYAGQVTLSTSWARYSLTVNIPSIAGKTIGTTANTSYLQVNLWVSGGTTFDARTGSLGIQSNTFDFWGVQLEEGSSATPFARNTNSVASELAACQRYYESGTNGETFLAWTSAFVPDTYRPVFFKATKLYSPTVTVTVTAGNNNSAGNGAVHAVNTGMFVHKHGVANTAFPYNSVIFNWTASCEL